MVTRSELKDRILVIGSDRRLLGPLNRRLGERGYFVASLDPGSDALQNFIDSTAPRLVIIDLDAPRMTGIEVCLGIRVYSAVPTLVLTASETGPDRFRSLDVKRPGKLGRVLSIDEVTDWVDCIARGTVKADGGL